MKWYNPKEWFSEKPKDPYVLINEEASKTVLQTDKTKGKVDAPQKMWPKNVGEEHPVDFSELERWYRDDAFAHALVDKHVDFVMGGGLSVESKDKRAKELIEQFIRDNNFETLIRAWLRKAFITGNGFLEIGGDEDEAPAGLKVLDPNTMYVKRDDEGHVEEYNQWGGFGHMVGGRAKIEESWSPGQIAHIRFNIIGNSAYGAGLIRPLLFGLKSKNEMLVDMVKLMKKKANNPYVIYVGNRDKGELPQESDITSVRQKLEWIRNQHEWVFSDNVRMTSLDAGSLGDKFTAPLELVNQELIFGGQIPAVLMGLANVPEGLAKEQGRMWMYRVKSIQEETEKVIENQIFSRILTSEGLESKEGVKLEVEIVWGVPSVEEKHAELDMLYKLLGHAKFGLLTDDIINETETRIRELLDFEEVDVSGEREKEQEEEEEQPIVPPDQLQRDTTPDGKGKKVPGDKSPPQKAGEWYRLEDGHEHDCTCHETLKEGDGFSVKEWVGFDYDKYLGDIIEFINSEDFITRDTVSFNFVPGSDRKDWTFKKVKYKLTNVLTTEQVPILREVLINGFEEGKSLRDIKNDILERVKPETLKVGKRKITPEQRSMVMARVETVRATNEGVLKQYEKFDVTDARWIASAGDRTCPFCISQNGSVLPISEAKNMIPVHVGCRCTWGPV